MLYSKCKFCNGIVWILSRRKCATISQTCHEMFSARVAMCLRWCCLKNAWHRIKCHSFFCHPFSRFFSYYDKDDEEDVKNFALFHSLDAVRQREKNGERVYAKHNSWNMHSMSWSFVFKLLLDKFSGCFGLDRCSLLLPWRWRWTNYTNSFTNTWRLYSLNVCEKCECS